MHFRHSSLKKRKSRKEKNIDFFLYLGVVLFPEATLPLRVIQNNSVAAVERALSQVDAPYTIGVVCKLPTLFTHACVCICNLSCHSILSLLSSNIVRD